MLNSLIGSLLVYKMSVLSNLPKYLIDEIETELRKYILGPKPKVALEILKTCKNTGGVRLFDLKNKEMALKT